MINQLIKRSTIYVLLLVFFSTNSFSINFVHKRDAERNFKSVILSVHGWNGSCRETFGKDNKSLFHVLDKNRFYDFDCFDYNSTHLSITKNVERLYRRIKTLQEYDYENIMLVTHSTGGILALDLLTSLILNDKNNIDGSNSKKLIRNIYAWATPINGLRSHIDAAGEFARLIGYSPETLADLKSDSPYLRNLKSRLSKIDDSEFLNIPIVLLQGQKEDYVVLPVKETDKHEEWFKDNHWELVNTGMGHIENIGKPGGVEIPNFPAYTIEREALLDLKLLPRLDRIFPDGVNLIPKSLEDRQLKVVNGMFRYGKRRFRDAFFTYRDFFKKMFSHKCVRSSKVDKQLVKNLLSLTKSKFANPSAEIVGDFTNYIPQVLRQYNPDGLSDICKLGHNSRSVAFNIIEMLKVVNDNVVDFFKKNPDQIKTYLSSEFKTVSEFEAEMIKLIERFFESGDPSVQYVALNTLSETIKISSIEAIKKSNIIAKIRKFNKDNSHYLSEKSKIAMSNIYDSLLAKDGDISKEVSSLLLKEVNYRNKKQPLWVSLANDDSVIKLVKTIEDNKISNIEEFNFVADVAAKGGASGNNIKVREISKDIAMKAVKEQPKETQRIWLQSTDKIKYNYGSVKRGFELQYNSTFNNINGGRL